jgi:hypothetical protein
MSPAREAPAISSMLSSAYDLDVPLTEDDIDLVEEFEARWRVFMHDKPELMVVGGRGKRVVALKSKIMEAKMNKTAVERELKEQLKVFQKSRDAQQQHHQICMQEAVATQKSIKDTLERELDNAAIADHLESQLVPWEHFLDCVDKAASPKASSNGKRTIRPSARAMALVDPAGNPSDVQLRAYRIDHALLTAQVKMLHKEIECCEKKTGHEIIGKFLTENNIWTLLSKKSSMPS